MIAKPLNRWLLVNFAGYPYAPNSLMPDNGLATLAAVLLRQRKQVEILDYCTVSAVRRLMPPGITPALSRAWETIRHTPPGVVGKVKQLGVLLSLHRLERQRQQTLDCVVTEISGEIIRKIKTDGIDAVGFKLWNGDGLEGAGQMAKAIRRECPQVKIFGGGPQVDIFMERILASHGAFDALVYGEGEETIQALAETGGAAEALMDIPNLVYRRAGQIQITPERMVANLDDLPIPVYDSAVYPAMSGDEKIKIIVIDESRGCRNQCAFCIHPVKSHQQQRVKSIPRLMREMDDLKARHGWSTFRFAGSCTPYSLLNEFAATVVQTDRKCIYATFAHIRDSDEADFANLQKSGCVAMFFGVESGSQRILDGMHKGVRATAIAETIRRANQAGIFTVGSFIFPAPGEDAVSEQETLDLLTRVPFGGVIIQPTVVVPRTRWFMSPEKYGIVIRDRERYLQQALRWKAKLLLPTRFWQDLPIRITGWRYPHILKQTAGFTRQVNAMGINTAISDDTYLMSVRAGKNITEFKDDAIRAFFTGDGAAIRSMAEDINSHV
jgi:radical SAM superfamily enzyme YgiQ (UPF0313 family)